MNEGAERWLAFARGDLRMAGLVMEEAMNPLFAYLTRKLLDKSLTVAYALALHTLKIRTHAINQSLIGTSGQLFLFSSERGKGNAHYNSTSVLATSK
jgi:hypothetical protein